MKPTDPVVSVFGANDPPEGSAAYQTARAVGRKLAELGYAVANGGYGGTMAASSRGAAEAGGRTIGVVCSIWNSSPNKYVQEVVRTDSLNERAGRLIELGSGGYVALPGATGTLLELASVWEMTSRGLLARRPIVCVGRFWRPLVDMMSQARPGSENVVTLIDGPEGLEFYFKAGRSG